MLATTKTLPERVFKFDMYTQNYEVTKLGANPSGDKVTWKTVNLDEGKISDIYLLGGYVSAVMAGQGQDLIEDTLIAHSWKKSKVFFDAAYGITDKLTLFLNMSYERAMLDYTDEYVAQSEMINQHIGELIPYNAAPDKAEADNLNDTFLGIKYNFGTFSAAYKVTTGFLKTGHDSLEKDLSDGVQELETSRGYDQYHIYIFKDLNILNNPVHLTGGYIMLGDMTQNFLDNKMVDFRPGDMLIIKANIPINPIKNISINTSITGIFHGKDKYKGGNSAFSNTDPSGTRNSGYDDWTTVPKSDGSSWIGNIEISYQPKIFIKAFVNGTFILSNDATGQLYNFPGRLQPGNMIGFGITLFAKI